MSDDLEDAVAEYRRAAALAEQVRLKVTWRQLEPEAMVRAERELLRAKEGMQAGHVLERLRIQVARDPSTLPALLDALQRARKYPELLRLLEREIKELREEEGNVAQSELREYVDWHNRVLDAVEEEKRG